MSQSAKDPLLGTPVLGGFVITGVLGAGGMGSVYVAEHQRISKKVAIKVLHPHMTSNRDIVARFLAEARAASALDHPNIIEVVDGATLDDGRDYIALEYLNGDALDDYLRSHKQLDLSTALHILAQTCCGLEAAHHRGIIHRDLKPANLFVAPTELDPLRTKILDFGIAKLTDTVMAGGIETGSNAIAGTPGYMAPEQARGMRDVDHRADIYALGAVAYRMMSGSLPYEGESLGEIIYQQLSAPPPDIRTKRADLPAGWAHAIMAAVGNDPSMRQPSARHFALELAAATPGGIEIVRRVAPLLFSDIWIARNRQLVSRLPQGAAVASAPKGATASHAPSALAATQSERPMASPVTTLSSAAGYLAAPAHQPAVKSRTRMAILAGGGTAAAIAGVAAIVALSGSSANTAETDAAPMASSSPDAAKTAAVSARLDAAALEPDAAVKTAAKKVVVKIKLTPRDAIIELDGHVAKSPLRLVRGSEHRIVVSRRGYKSQKREWKATKDESLPITLERLVKTTSSDSKTTAKPDPIVKPEGPISTTLEDAKPKPIGPTTDTL